MGTYLERNETLLLRQAWEFIGDAAFDIVCREEHGEVCDPNYFDVYKIRNYIKAIQVGKLTDQQKEPILACIAALVNKYPAPSILQIPPA